MFEVGETVLSIHPEYEGCVGTITHSFDMPGYKTVYGIAWKNDKGRFFHDDGWSDSDLLPKFNPNDLLKKLCLK